MQKTFHRNNSSKADDDFKRVKTDEPIRVAPEPATPTPPKVETCELPQLNDLLEEFCELEKKLDEKTKTQLLTKSNFQEKKNIARMEELVEMVARR